jgi:hypothetical protein
MTTSDRGPDDRTAGMERPRHEPAEVKAPTGPRRPVLEPRLVLAVLLAVIGVFLQVMVWVAAAHLSEATEWAWAMVVGSVLCAAAFLAVGVLVADRVPWRRADIGESASRPPPQRRSTVADPRLRR